MLFRSRSRIWPSGTLHGLEIQRRMPDGQIRDLREVRPTDAVQPNDVILVRERLF